jgi:hypothetical protein
LIEVNQKICRLRPITADEALPGKKKRRMHSSRKSVTK